MPPRDNKYFHDRGYLQHADLPSFSQSITFRLHDAVPQRVVDRWKDELEWHDRLDQSDPAAIELRRRLDRFQDAGYGACWLARPEIASIVEGALLHFHGVRYTLAAWCVMPNHVHALISTISGMPLDSVVHSWKSFSAVTANRVLGRTGSFWSEDYHDRFIRDIAHRWSAVRYIERNPVKAGLVRSVDEWNWSSASAERRGLSWRRE